MTDDDADGQVNDSISTQIQHEAAVDSGKEKGTIEPSVQNLESEPAPDVKDLPVADSTQDISSELQEVPSPEDSENTLTDEKKITNSVELSNDPTKENNPIDANDDDDDDLQVLQVVKLVKSNGLPNNARLTLTLDELKPGSEIFASLRKDPDADWRNATIIDRKPTIKGSIWHQHSFRVRFDHDDSRGIERFCESNEIAYTKTFDLHFGNQMRVLAYYPTDPKEPTSKRVLKSGLIAERPKPLNGNRYLIFFDNGLALYSNLDETFCIFQLVTHDPTFKNLDNNKLYQLFMKRYFEMYPDVTMLKLSVGEEVFIFSQQSMNQPKPRPRKAHVVKLDGKVALVEYEDNTSEWIFRGSWRIFLIYRSPPVQNCLLEQNQANGASTGHKFNILPGMSNIRAINHGIKRMNPRQMSVRRTGNFSTPIMEYECPDEVEQRIVKSDDIDKEEPLPPGAVQDLSDLNYDSSSQTETAFADNVGGASRCPIPAAQALLSGNVAGGRKNTARKRTGGMSSVLSETPINLQPRWEPIYTPKGSFSEHICSDSCLGGVDETTDWKNINPFCVPIRLGWERIVMLYGNYNRISYKAPCLKMLRSIDEVAEFLRKTGSLLDIDMFSFASFLRIRPDGTPPESNIARARYYLDDLSGGSEPQPVSIINELNYRKMDESFKYNPIRYAHPNLRNKELIDSAFESEFLSCCSCTDNCADSDRCECQVNLTRESEERILKEEASREPAYIHKRLLEFKITGIFECNSRCPCNSRCGNRVVQNGIRARLQVFRTKSKGWGVRVLHDVPRGSFLCVYTARMLDSSLAETEGAQFGDAYLADLDYIDICEELQNKSDYESEVECSDDELAAVTNKYSSKRKRTQDERMANGHVSRDSSESSFDQNRASESDDSDDETSRQSKQRLKAKHVGIPSWAPVQLDGADDSHSSDSDDSIICLDEDKPFPKPMPLITPQIMNLSNIIAANHMIPMMVNYLPNGRSSSQPAPSTSLLATNNSTESYRQFSLRDRSKRPRYKEPSLDDTIDNYPRSQSLSSYSQRNGSGDKHASSKVKTTKHKSTGGKYDSSPRIRNGRNDSDRRQPNQGIKLRQYYGEGHVYTLDARVEGNIGRFMNHSCDPNSFVQNVFIDTQDLRFPWVCFFAKKDIKAYEELTWDYNYVPDSIPGRKLVCHCESANCRVRLL